MNNTYLVKVQEFWRSLNRHQKWRYALVSIFLMVGIGGLGVSLFSFPKSFFWFQEESHISLLKIGFSPDWEYGSRKRLKHKLTNQAPAELTKVVDFFNKEFQADLVVGGGDYIESSGVKKETAKKQLIEINGIFKKTKAPRHYALGNHDMRALTKGEILEILELEAAHSIIDEGDWRLVIFDTNFNEVDGSDRNEDTYTLGYVSQQERDWLDQALDTERPTIVFSHHSPISTLSNETDTVPTTNIINEGEVRSLIERHPNVVAVMSGHTPYPQMHELNGIHYFVGDTLVNEEGLGAFATIEARYDRQEKKARILFEHYGKRRRTFEAEKSFLPVPLP